jgi:DNA topoisomerase-3
MANIYDIETDPALKKILEGTEGIGTTATRYKIIETLLDHGLATRKDRKYIVPTQSGHELVSVAPAELASPGLTAVAESYLSKVESGEISRESFVEAYEKRVVAYDAYAVANPPASRLGSHKPKRYRPSLSVDSVNDGRSPTLPSTRSRRKKPSLRDPNT